MKLYIHNQESVQENDIHKIVWNFQIQTDHLITIRKPDQVIINTKKEKEKAVL